MRKITLTIFSFVIWFLLVWPFDPVSGKLDLQSVIAGVVVAIFVGLLFAQLYRTLALFGEGPFFAQDSAATGIDYIYFSFVCITTLGFGDLSPASGVGEMAAIVEAVLGQLYLVTVVALFVGNLGLKRRESSG